VIRGTLDTSRYRLRLDGAEEGEQMGEFGNKDKISRLKEENGGKFRSGKKRVVVHTVVRQRVRST
jgi:hypothetical protein